MSNFLGIFQFFKPFFLFLLGFGSILSHFEVIYNTVHIRPSVFLRAGAPAPTRPRGLASPPENAAILRLLTPAVNAGSQKSAAGPAPRPFSPVRYLTEAPLSDSAVSRPRRETQLVCPIRTIFFLFYFRPRFHHTTGAHHHQLAIGILSRKNHTFGVDAF